MVTPLRQFCLNWLKQKADKHRGDILNVGSRSDHYNYRNMFSKATKFRNVDIVWGRFVDIVCDAADMHTIPSESIDTILAIFMLYGPKNVIPVLDEFKRVLKPRGTLLCTYQPIDPPFYILNHNDPKVRVTDGGRWKIDGDNICGCRAQLLIKEKFNLKEIKRYHEQNRIWLFMEATNN